MLSFEGAAYKAQGSDSENEARFLAAQGMISKSQTGEFCIKRIRLYDKEAK